MNSAINSRSARGTSSRIAIGFLAPVPVVISQPSRVESRLRERSPVTGREHPDYGPVARVRIPYGVLTSNVRGRARHWRAGAGTVAACPGRLHPARDRAGTAGAGSGIRHERVDADGAVERAGRGAASQVRPERAAAAAAQAPAAAPGGAAAALLRAPAVGGGDPRIRRRAAAAGDRDHRRGAAQRCVRVRAGAPRRTCRGPARVARATSRDRRAGRGAAHDRRRAARARRRRPAGPGDRVAADLQLLDAHALHVDESTLTGESRPRSRSAGDRAFAGTFVTDGEAYAQVEAIGADTRLAGIARLSSEHVRPSTPLARELRSVVVRIAVIAVAIGVTWLESTCCSGATCATRRCWRSASRRAGARGAAPHSHALACRRCPATCTQRRARAASGVGRDARLDHRHLHRQDGHADLQRDGGRRAVDGGRRTRGDRWRRVRADGTHRPVTRCRPRRARPPRTRRRALLDRSRRARGWSLDRPGDPMEAANRCLREPARAPRQPQPTCATTVPVRSVRRRMSVLVDHQLLAKGAPDSILERCIDVPERSACPAPRARVAGVSRARRRHAQRERRPGLSRRGRARSAPARARPPSRTRPTRRRRFDRRLQACWHRRGRGQPATIPPQPGRSHARSASPATTHRGCSAPNCRKTRASSPRSPRATARSSAASTPRPSCGSPTRSPTAGRWSR